MLATFAPVGKLKHLKSNHCDPGPICVSPLACVLQASSWALPLETPMVCAQPAPCPALHRATGSSFQSLTPPGSPAFPMLVLSTVLYAGLPGRLLLWDQDPMKWSMPSPPSLLAAPQSSLSPREFEASLDYLARPCPKTNQTKQMHLAVHCLALICDRRHPGWHFCCPQIPGVSLALLHGGEVKSVVLPVSLSVTCSRNQQYHREWS